MEQDWKEATAAYDKCKNELAKAEALAEKSLKELKQVFDVDSVEAARKLKRQLEKEKDAAESAFKKAKKEFDDKWTDAMTET